MTDDLARNYGKVHVTALAGRYGKTEGAVIKMAVKLGIYTPRWGRRHVWTDEERELLRRKYADTPTDELAAELGLDASRITSQAGRLGLRKSDEYMERIKPRKRERSRATWARKRGVNK